MDRGQKGRAEIPLELVTGKDVWPEIHRTARQTARGRRYVAVAYMGSGSHDERLPLGKGDTLVVDCSLTTAQGGQTDPREVRKFVEAGVTVYQCEHLHAKVYVLGDTAIVGSPNASHSSEVRLEEAILVTRDPDTVAAARAFVESLTVGKQPIDETWLAQCEQVFRPRASGQGGSRDAASQEPYGARLWLVPTSIAMLKQLGNFYCGDVKSIGSGKLSLRAADKVTARRRTAGAYPVSLQYDRRPPFDEGDLVIQCNYPPEGVGGYTLAYLPCRVEMITQRPSGTWAVTLLRPNDAVRLRVAELRSGCAPFGVVLPRFGDAPQAIHEPEARRALLALWHRT